jgi:hypothetical protein
MAVGLGCGVVKRAAGGPSEASPSNSNKTLTDKAVDITVGDEKTGIPECDEVVDFFRHEADNPDDNYVTKAVKATVLNKIKESFRKSIEENKTDKVEMAKQCRDFKLQLEKYKAEEESKQK